MGAGHASGLRFRATSGYIHATWNAAVYQTHDKYGITQAVMMWKENHASKWRSMAVRRGGYWGYFRHDWDEAARRFMTHIVTLPP
jgi:hypothetical protein